MLWLSLLRFWLWFITLKGVVVAGFGLTLIATDQGESLFVTAFGAAEVVLSQWGLQAVKRAIQRRAELAENMKSGLSEWDDRYRARRGF